MNLIELLPNPVFIKNTSGIYTDCNKAFEELTGFNRQQIIGASAYQIAPKELADIYNKADQRLLKTGVTQEYRSLIIGNDRCRYDVIFFKNLIKTDQEITGIFGFIKEIHKIKGNTPYPVDILYGKKLLTSREIDVLQYLSKGLTSGEIALQLGLSRHTVNHHLKIIYSKLGTTNKISTISFARKINLID